MTNERGTRNNGISSVLQLLRNSALSAGNKLAKKWNWLLLFRITNADIIKCGLQNRIGLVEVELWGHKPWKKKVNFTCIDVKENT